MNTLTLAIKYIFIDVVGGVLRWPIWWYTRGLALITSGSIHSVERYYQSIALGVWIKNLFVPMYGLRDWQGRLISFLVRLVQIAFRSLFLVVRIVIAMIGIIMYMILPIVTVIQLLYHAGGSIIL